MMLFRSSGLNFRRKRRKMKNSRITILFPIQTVETAFPCPSHSTSFPIIYAAHMTGIAANQPEKKEKIKPIYRFFLKLPHQSIILFTVLNMIFHLLSGFQLPSALLPHGPATFADKADSSESALPGFLLLLYSHFSKQRFCLHL